LQELRPNIQNENAQAVQGVENYDEDDYELEIPGFVDYVDGSRPIAAHLLHKKGRRNVQPNKQQNPNAANTVEHPRQHRAAPLILEPGEKWNASPDRHKRLLMKSIEKEDNSLIIIAFSIPQRKVTIITEY
jgi:hypothetical protein